MLLKLKKMDDTTSVNRQNLLKFLNTLKPVPQNLIDELNENRQVTIQRWSACTENHWEKIAGIPDGIYIFNYFRQHFASEPELPQFSSEYYRFSLYGLDANGDPFLPLQGRSQEVRQVCNFISPLAEPKIASKQAKKPVLQKEHLEICTKYLDFSRIKICGQLSELLTITLRFFFIYKRLIAIGDNDGDDDLETNASMSSCEYLSDPESDDDDDDMLDEATQKYWEGVSWNDSAPEGSTYQSF
jgi:hypothetical protein